MTSRNFPKYHKYLKELEKYETRSALLLVSGITLLLFTPVILKDWGYLFAELSCFFSLSLCVTSIVVLFVGAKKLRSKKVSFLRIV